MSNTEINFVTEHSSFFRSKLNSSRNPKKNIIMAVSKVRQNFHSNSEANINKQINMEFYASYVYLSMVSKKNGF